MTCIYYKTALFLNGALEPRHGKKNIVQINEITVAEAS